MSSIEARGISRRSFLKLCSGLAAWMGLSARYIPDIAHAIEKAAIRPPVLWLNFSSDSGCTESFVKLRYPSIAKVVLELISLDYNETIMAAAGKGSDESLERTRQDYQGKYVCIVEGGLPMADNGAWLTIGGRTGLEIARSVCADAAVVIPIGSCAFDGGVVTTGPNTSQAKGIMEATGLDPNKFINVPGCPVNPEWVMAVLVNYLMIKEPLALDGYRRPMMIYGQKIHDNCERRAHFDEGRFVEQFGSKEEALGYCLYKMGCKGPATYSSCPKVRWNDKVNWCIGSGSPCIGCCEPNFTNQFAGFYSPLPDVKIPFGEGIRRQADRVGAAVAIATGVGIGAHLIARAAKGKVCREHEKKEEDEG